MRFLLYLMMFCVLGGMFPAGNGFAVQQVEDLDRLRANVLALDRVQNNIRREIAGRKKDGAISLQEQYELEVFIGYLQERNRDYCAQLEQQAGRPAVADLPCPAEQAELPAAKVRTVDEELAELDQSLAEALGAFDEMLLKEQERVAARQPRQRESGGGADGSGAGGSGTAGEGQGESGGKDGAGGLRQETDSRQGRAPAAGTTTAGKPGQPGGQVGGVARTGRDELSADDDIVARQLREAAEKETDPELKEKLWAEYRKYKEGL